MENSAYKRLSIEVDCDQTEPKIMTPIVVEPRNSCEIKCDNTVLKATNNRTLKQLLSKSSCVLPTVKKSLSYIEATKKDNDRTKSVESDSESSDVLHDSVYSTHDKSPVMKLLEPLYKYITNNKCLLCGFESKSAEPYSIKRHLVCHLPNKNFKCDICEKLFSVPEFLASHKANIHVKDKLEVSCKDCHKKFSAQSGLNSHRRRHHKPVQMHACSICNREFKESSVLKQHYRIHTGEKPYTCTVCDETFRTREMLRNHSLKHNTKKLYSCEHCDKNYNNKRILNEHMNLHKETSDIKCRICGKTFAYKSNLSRHMFVHFDKRPHKCETCGLTFKLSQHLKSHIASHH